MRSTWFFGGLALAFASLAIGLAGLAAGCSNASNTSTSASDGGDASTSDVAPEATVVDAGPDIDQDPDVYPANHHPIPQITYNGGAIIDHARIVTVTFTGDAHRDSLRPFDHFISGSDWWKQTAEGYCVDAGAHAGCVGAGSATAPEGGAWMPDGSTDDAGDGFLDVELAYDFASASIGDNDIQAWLAKHIVAGDFPAPDSETIYALYFPKTTHISLDPNTVSCLQFGAYHNAAPVTFDGGTSLLVAYAAIPYCDYGQGDLLNYQEVTTSASHEFAEAVTDPHPNKDTAYYLQGNDAWLGALSYGGGENGDMCTYVADPSYDESGYTVQRIWSNQAAAQSKQPCQPFSLPYFAAALRTSAQKIPPDNHVSDGYVFVKRGQSVDVIADVFSQTPLAHDLLLYAGKDKPGATDPSDMAPPDDNLQVSLSQQQVHNGNGVIVTFTAPSTATAGDFRLVLRAVLEKNDYNDWPILVHVQ
jgi:hypothetical protein